MNPRGLKNEVEKINFVYIISHVDQQHLIIMAPENFVCIYVLVHMNVYRYTTYSIDIFLETKTVIVSFCFKMTSIVAWPCPSGPRTVRGRARSPRLMPFFV